MRAFFFFFFFFFFALLHNAATRTILKMVALSLYI